MEIVECSVMMDDLMDEVIQEHEDLHWIRRAEIMIGCVTSDRRKVSGRKLTLGECVKVKPLYKPFCPYDFLIVFYLPCIDGLNTDQLRILMYHELLHIGMDDTGEEVRYIVNPHDVEDFRKVIDGYGLDWAKVKR